MSDWNAYDQTVPADSDLGQAARRYQELAEKKKAIEDEMSALAEERILPHFDEEPGERAILAGDRVVTCKRAEVYNWDQGALTEIFGESELPSYARRRITIDKRRFDRLEESERRALLPALTRKPGSPRIEVVPAKESET